MEAIRRPRRSLLAFVAVALVLGACSSGGPTQRSEAGPPPAGDHAKPPAGGQAKPLARVVAASDRAIDAESMHMTFEMVLAGAGQELRGSGEADVAFGDEIRQHMVFRYDSFPGMPDGLEMEMIMDGTVVYMRIPQLQGVGGFATEWISMDVSKAVPGFEDLAAFGAGQNDPSNAFGYLQGAEEAEELGTETIDGVETTHYEVKVDLAEAAKDVPADLRDEMRKVIRQFRGQFGTTAMPFEVWVDGDGLARRMVYRMEADGFSMEMTVNVTEYGNDFDLDVPPASDVTDVTELAGAALG
jgi:hypothetical protein